MAAEGGREAEIPAKVAENLDAGNTGNMMLAVPLVCVPYNGFPRTLNMRGAISSALAEQKEAEENTVITMQIGNPVMTINGKESNIDNEGTTPVVVDNRTLLPVRALVEGIGGTVEWNPNTQTVTLTYKDDEIRLTINQAAAYLNDKEQTLDVTSVIINDRTMLPIRFIAESFGYKVDWTQETQTVTITNAADKAQATAEPTVQPTAEPAGEETSEDGKALVVYYSATGTTERIANYIAETLNADIFELEPTEPYTSDDLDWTDESSRVVYEHDNESERDVELTATTVDNWDLYDTVFIGYPIWWGIAAWPVDNFVKANDFTDKTVVPFCTSASSPLGESGTLLEKMAGTGNWEEGMRFRSGTSESDVRNWAENYK